LAELIRLDAVRRCSHRFATMTHMHILVDGRTVARIQVDALDAWWHVTCLRSPSTLARFRLASDAYRRLLVAQGGVCGVCGRGAWRMGVPAPLSIDHDHVC